MQVILQQPQTERLPELFSFIEQESPETRKQNFEQDSINAAKKPLGKSPMSGTMRSPKIKRLHLPVSKINLRNSSDNQVFKFSDLRQSQVSLKSTGVKDLNTTRSSGFESAKNAIKKTLLHKPKQNKVLTTQVSLAVGKPQPNQSAV